MKPNFSPFHNRDFIVTEPYGEYDEGGVHNGVDLVTLNDTKNVELYSIVNGIVIGTGYSETLGNYVTIRSSEDTSIAFRYAHLSSINVTTSQRITLSTILGIMGESGEAYGVHLHIEARNMIGNDYDASLRVNPCDYLGIENISYKNKKIVYFYPYITRFSLNKSKFNWAIYGNKH